VRLRILLRLWWIMVGSGNLWVGVSIGIVSVCMCGIVSCFVMWVVVSVF